MAIRLDSSSLVTVFGGSGFVGRHAVRALARRGCRIRAAVRRPDLAGHLQPMGNVGQIHAVQANLRFEDSIRRAIEGAAGVVNLVGILAESGRQSFQAVHVEGTRRLARAAREAGVHAFVHVSAIGADPRSPSRYARSKAEGEKAVLAEFPDAVILRPSIVFGPEDEFFNRFASLARFTPALPLIGGGRTRFQPIYVGDLAEAIVAGLDGRARPGTVYELGGPETLSFAEIMRLTLRYSERRRCLLPLPFWMAKLQALATKPLPQSLRPITLDQVRMLQRDNVVSKEAASEGRTLAGLGVTAPQAVETVVPGYLVRFRPKGQFGG